MPPSPDIPSLPDPVPGRTGMIESFDLAKDMMGWRVGVPDPTTRAMMALARSATHFAVFAD